MKAAEANYQTAVAQEEAAVFKDFFEATKTTSVAEFEARFYDDRREELEQLARLQKEREQLASKIADPAEMAVLETNTELWAKKAADEEVRLAELTEEEAAAREAFRLKTSKVEAARDQVTAMEEAKKEATARAKTVTSELEAAYRQRANRNHALLSGQRAMRRLRKARYEIFRTAYVEAVVLPVDREQFEELFADQAEEDEAADESVLENVAKLQVDYGSIKEIITPEEDGGRKKDKEANSNRISEATIQLETELKELEEELKKFTVAEDVNLTEE